MKKIIIALSIMAIVLCMTQTARAVGTSAGTVITNQASADYTIGATSFTVNSGTVSTTVDEMLDVSVVWQDAGNVTVVSGAVNQVLTFSVTNIGNGADTYTLSIDNALAGDDFNPTNGRIYIDDGDNIYDAGDTLYSGPADDPTLAADGAITIFLVNDIPGGLTDGWLGNSQLTADSNTGGSGTPGTVYANAGDGGVDAVDGTSGGNDNAIGTYIVANTTVSIVKSQVITDPFGGTSSVPGATIQYTLDISVTGSGTATGVVITDPIPANTTYNAGTLILNAGALTDAVDGDAGDVGGTTPGTVTVSLGDMTAATTHQIIFEVIIN